MARVLALDLGLRRVGVAISDPLGLTGQPVATLPARHGAPDVAALQRLVQEHDVGQLVVGLPLRLDGSEGPEARRARETAAALGAALELPVDLWDERLTSVEAERALRAAGAAGGTRRQVRDRTAAVLILQSWLENRRRKEAP